MKRKYKVIEGTHWEGKREYKKGETFTSSYDMCATFSNKFECLGEVTETTSASLVVSVKDEVKPAETSVSESVEKPDEQPSAKEVETPSAPIPSVVTTEYGEDVTNQFQKAIDAGVKVYVKSGWFNVYDPDDKGGEPINVKKLRKDAVDEVIDAYITPAE